MATREYFSQLRPFEAPKAGDAELIPLPPTSPRMEQVITQLAATHGVDFSQQGATLNLDVPAQQQRWMIANLGDRVGVTRCQVNTEQQLAADLDMVFAITAAGWEPREIIHAESPWDEFAQAAQAQNLTIFDEQGDLCYALFTEFWALQLEQLSGWEQTDHADELVT